MTELGSYDLLTGKITLDLSQYTARAILESLKANSEHTSSDFYWDKTVIDGLQFMLDQIKAGQQEALMLVLESGLCDEDLKNDKKIMAIKNLRQQTKCGLKEAKDAVEEYGLKKGYYQKTPHGLAMADKPAAASSPTSEPEEWDFNKLYNVLTTGLESNEDPVFQTSRTKIMKFKESYFTIGTAKIYTIKDLRQKTGCSLKQAKDVVDSYFMLHFKTNSEGWVMNP